MVVSSFSSFRPSAARAAYYAVCAAVAGSVSDAGEVSRKDLSKAATELFTRSALLGEVKRLEASNPVTFQNAVDLLVRHRVLAAAEEGDGTTTPSI